MSGSAEVFSCRWSVVPGDADGLMAHLAPRLAGRSLHVVLDRGLAQAQGTPLTDALQRLGPLDVHVPAVHGESIKQWSHLQSLVDHWLSHGLRRDAVVLTLGGGTLSDMVGFAASIALRGVPVMHVATTLLSMADAALGGKTGINTPQGKNLVGTFHHPEEVVHWVGALSTLDRRERRSGWAEITKSCLLAGEDAFSWLEGHAAAGAAGDPTVLAEAVDRACRLKADVVTRDPHESGLRRVLNLGHTLGHAAEHALGYGALTHGEAVSMGLCAALELGVWLGVTRDAGLPDRVQAVLDTFSLPTRLPLLPWSTWSAALASDKKQTRDGLQWVLLQAPGEPLLHRVPSATLQGWLQDPSRARSALADPRS